MKKRLRRQVTCDCGAYHFPHRIFGGRCNGIHIVEQNAGGADCASCFLNNNGCEVLKGQEHPRECAYVLDFAAYNEIKL